MNDAQIEKPLVSRRPLSEQVYEILESRIVSGALPPGSRLAEEAIADEFGISRSPAREAIAELERVGLAERSGPRDRRVLVPSEKLIFDVYATWAILETGRTYLSSLAATKEDHKTIRALLRAMDQALKTDDMPEYSRLWAEFHRIVRSRCDNEMLNHAIQGFERYRKWLSALYHSEPETSQVSMREHKKIAQHYINRNLVGLTQSIEAHVRRQRDRFFDRHVAARETLPPPE